MFSSIRDIPTMRRLVGVAGLPHEIIKEAKAHLEALEQQEAKRKRIWNSARELARILRIQVNYRLDHGWTENEAARGVDEQESMDWEEIRKRISYLRKHSLRRIRQGRQRKNGKRHNDGRS